MVGRFTTDPKLAMFHIHDLVKYIPNPFPVSVRLYLDGETAEPGLLPSILTKDPVLLLDDTVETSLVCTCDLCAENEGTDTSTVVEIPVNQDILVSFLGKDSQGKSNSLETLNTLNTKTLALWRRLLSPEGERATMLRLRYSGESPTQHKLFTMVRKGWERECQSIKLPPRLQVQLSPGSGELEVYQALFVDSEVENQYMPLVSSSLASSDEDSENNESVDDDTFISDNKKVPHVDTGCKTRLLHAIAANWSGPKKGTV